MCVFSVTILASGLSASWHRKLCSLVRIGPWLVINASQCCDIEGKGEDPAEPPGWPCPGFLGVAAWVISLPVRAACCREMLLKSWGTGEPQGLPAKQGQGVPGPEECAGPPSRRERQGADSF